MWASAWHPLVMDGGLKRQHYKYESLKINVQIDQYVQIKMQIMKQTKDNQHKTVQCKQQEIKITMEYSK